MDKIATLENSGNVQLYHVYNLIRPDQSLGYNEIIHFDALFMVDDHGQKRRVVKVSRTDDARPVEMNFTKDEKLNMPVVKVNDVRFIMSDILDKKAFAVGDVIIHLGGIMDDDKIDRLRKDVRKRGPIIMSLKENQKKGKASTRDIESTKNPNICLDLWMLNQFCGSKANSNLRFFDDVANEYRNWKRIIKYDNQDIVVELGD